MSFRVLSDSEYNKLNAQEKNMYDREYLEYIERVRFIEKIEKQEKIKIPYFKPDKVNVKKFRPGFYHKIMKDEQITADTTEADNLKKLCSSSLKNYNFENLKNNKIAYRAVVESPVIPEISDIKIAINDEISVSLSEKTVIDAPVISVKETEEYVISVPEKLIIHPDEIKIDIPENSVPYIDKVVVKTPDVSIKTPENYQVQNSEVRISVPDTFEFRKPDCNIKKPDRVIVSGEYRKINIENYSLMTEKLRPKEFRCPESTIDMSNFKFEKIQLEYMYVEPDNVDIKIEPLAISNTFTVPIDMKDITADIETAMRKIQKH